MRSAESDETFAARREGATAASRSRILVTREHRAILDDPWEAAPKRRRSI